MAKVNGVKLCARCMTEMQGDECQTCGRKMQVPLNTTYKEPEYLCIQREKLLLVSQKATAESLKNDIAEQILAKNQTEWVRSCTDKIRIAALIDAQLILRNLLHSNAEGETVKAVVGLAKNLGKLAQKIEDYVSEGGTINNLPTTTKYPSDDQDKKLLSGS